MNRKLAIKGAELGPCGICGDYGKLTIDHIPPKGSSRLKSAEMVPLVKLLTAEIPNKGNRLSQNGVSFRTICAECNNTRLGRDCDPSLIDYTNKIDAALKSKIYLPDRLTFRGKPQRILRSVVGHILAYGIERKPNGMFEKSLAKYFLNQDLNAPDELECYYWPYPYADQIIIRDALIGNINIQPKYSLHIKLIKFYPIAFLLTWNRHKSWNIQLDDLCRFGKMGFDAEANIDLNLSGMPGRRWPEQTIDPDNMLLLGRDAMYARPFTRSNSP